jgi:hypothetical protein
MVELSWEKHHSSRMDQKRDRDNRASFERSPAGYRLLTIAP